MITGRTVAIDELCHMLDEQDPRYITGR